MVKKSHISNVAHKFRLYESKSKCKAIDSLLLTTDKMWNMALGAIKNRYKKTGKEPIKIKNRPHYQPVVNRNLIKQEAVRILQHEENWLGN